MRVDEFRELGEDFHDLVGTLSAGCHHDNVGVTLLGDGVLEHGLSASERSRDEACTALGDRVEGVDYPDSGLHYPVRPWLLDIVFDCYLCRPFLNHCHVHVLAFGIGEYRYGMVDIVLSGLSH